MTSTNRKPLLFMGNSYSDLKAFPAEARRAVGFNLDFLQRGFDPENWKPMKTVGAGVLDAQEAARPQIDCHLSRRVH